ncbi:hypothetical protein V6N11_033670 [Hibiscus sabdariffa]|uniref:Uncharacterized protein n=1 Tax=Hibiscus sabdariffa TaxID=183260 RepID=A0ABR2PYP2_9ROSI
MPHKRNGWFLNLGDQELFLIISNRQICKISLELNGSKFSCTVEDFRHNVCWSLVSIQKKNGLKGRVLGSAKFNTDGAVKGNYGAADIGVLNNHTTKFREVDLDKLLEETNHRQL